MTQTIETGPATLFKHWKTMSDLANQRKVMQHKIQDRDHPRSRWVAEGGPSLSILLPKMPHGQNRKNGDPHTTNRSQEYASITDTVHRSTQTVFACRLTNRAQKLPHWRIIIRKTSIRFACYTTDD